MDNSKTFKILSKQIGEIEAIDAHTHINASHIAARGLHRMELSKLPGNFCRKRLNICCV